MRPARLAAIAFIYVCAAVGWFTLGVSVVHRTGESDQRLAKEVARLWGGRHQQVAPEAWFERPRLVREDVPEKGPDGKEVTRQVMRTVYDKFPVPLASSRVEVDLQLDQRRKGLLWYDNHAVAFKATYRFRPAADAAPPVYVQFSFPSREAIFDGFVFRVNGVEAPEVSDLSQGAIARASGPGEVVVEVAYRSRGLGEWGYSFTPSGVARVRDFQLAMTTDFAGIDFPAGTLSPTSRAPLGRGHRLEWSFDSLVTGQSIGMDPPGRLNPGPLTARITFFAPVGLLFFLAVTVILGLVRGRSLHPMNYVFLASAFFAFHLLLAYLVDHVDVNAAFVTAAATSVFLVLSYLRLVTTDRSALVEAGVAQALFLVLFSYAFFFEGYAGLTVTVGAVLTLFVLMQITGRVDWNQAFAAPPARRIED